MTILTFPTLNARGTARGPTSATWSLLANTRTLSSPFDGTVQTVAMPGARWRGTVAYTGLPAGDWHVLSAFLASLGGRAGRFTYSPPAYARRATASIPGTVRVNGAGQTGTSLANDGLHTATLVFKAGDWVSFPNAASRPQLHRITADATSDGAGAVTLSIAPQLRASPADNAVVTHDAPVGVFMLADDETGQASYRRQASLVDITLDIIEALA